MAELKRRVEYLYWVKYSFVSISTHGEPIFRRSTFSDLDEAAEFIKDITSRVDIYVCDEPKVQRLVVKELTESENTKLKELLE